MKANTFFRKFQASSQTRETESVKSVHFYFPNDLEADAPTNNQITIFSAGFKAFKDRCEQPQ
jgi:hypothetical protein